MHYCPRSYNNQNIKPKGGGGGALEGKKCQSNDHVHRRRTSFDSACSLSSDSTATDASSLSESSSLASSSSHKTKNRGNYNYHNHNKTKKQQQQRQQRRNRGGNTSQVQQPVDVDKTKAPASSKDENNMNNRNGMVGTLPRWYDAHKSSSFKSYGLNTPPTSSFVALDCEMVGVGPGGYESSCARVTMVDWDGQTFLDVYIQQTQPVTDFRTFVSGITPKDLKGATMTLDGCRIEVIKILQQRPILVGHALKNDLRALRINYPWYLTRDTATYGPFMKPHHHMPGVLCPRKLKDLVHEKLHKNIQVFGQPHSSSEDAIAAFDLYKSVHTSWEGMVKHQMDTANELQQRRMMMMMTHHAYHQHQQQQQQHYAAYHPQQHRGQQQQERHYVSVQ